MEKPFQQAELHKPDSCHSKEDREASDYVELISSDDHQYLRKHPNHQQLWHALIC